MELITSLTQQLVQSPLLIGLTIALLISASIGILDTRRIQAKRDGYLPPDHPDLPWWVGMFTLIEWSLKILLLILNWRVGVMVWIALFVLKVLPVLEIVGNLLMAPFKSRFVGIKHDQSSADEVRTEIAVMLEEMAQLCATWDDVPADETEFAERLSSEAGTAVEPHSDAIFERTWEIIRAGAAESCQSELQKVLTRLAAPYAAAPWNMPHSIELFTEDFVGKHGEEFREEAPLVYGRANEMIEEEYQRTGILYS